MSRVSHPMRVSPSFPLLNPQAVHVWFCELVDYTGRQDSLAAQLSDDERARAARFAFERDRQRFILSHGVLRLLLSRYTQMDAGEIQFVTGEHGKPAVSGPSGAAAGIQFSLSHSGAYALVAVAHGRDVGVDIEVPKADLECLKLAERFFAPAESQAIAKVHGEEQQRLFYRLWTAKEAYLKGRGVGLSLGLDRFAIVFDEPSSGAQVRLTDSRTFDPTWKIQSLSLPDHLAGAVAVEGGGCELHRYEATAYIRD